jgi:branched-chain amino acid transport system ATP-binding protein
MEGILKIAGVSVSFTGLRALSDVTFTLNSGEVRAVIGPNGAGKTTLFNAITGYVPMASGDVLLRGESLRGMAAYEISDKGVRRTFQNGGLFGEMTVLENLLTGLHSRINSGILGLLFGGRTARRAEGAAMSRARELLDLMDLTAIADRRVKDLPSGQQRMVEIARALATEPPLLLLDEPAVGLAPHVRDHLMAVIRNLAHEKGIGILLIEHTIDLVMAVSDVIVVLTSGEMIAEGTPDEIRKNRSVLEAYLGF